MQRRLNTDTCKKRKKKNMSFPTFFLENGEKRTNYKMSAWYSS